MKHKIIKIAALLVLLIDMSSCIHTSMRTRHNYPRHYHYHRGGRHW